MLWLSGPKWRQKFGSRQRVSSIGVRGRGIVAAMACGCCCWRGGGDGKFRVWGLCVWIREMRSNQSWRGLGLSHSSRGGRMQTKQNQPLSPPISKFSPRFPFPCLHFPNLRLFLMPLLFYAFYSCTCWSLSFFFVLMDFAGYIQPACNACTFRCTE
jgi:hypothetical protein